MNKASSKTPAGVLPLAALQAIAFAAGAGQVAATQLPAQTAVAGKPKVGRTLEVKGETAAVTAAAYSETSGHDGRAQGSHDQYGSGRNSYTYDGGQGNYGGGRGSYNGGQSNYTSRTGYYGGGRGSFRG
ncbi:hypothetical protein PF007_g32427 [Phytophthora fragariae]|nr:hypothetical protein PF007_g32427 [Phytophthora fragariae]